MKRDSLFDAVMVFKKKNRKANHFPGDGLFSGPNKAEAYKEYRRVWNCVDRQIKRGESPKLPAGSTPAFNVSASTPKKQSTEEASTPPLLSKLRSSVKRQGRPPLTGQALSEDEHNQRKRKNYADEVRRDKTSRARSLAAQKRWRSQQ